MKNVPNFSLNKPKFSNFFSYPFFLSLLFALVVAAYSAALNERMAAEGKYLSPVTEDFFPDFVRHFCLLHALRDLCLFDNAMLYLPIFLCAALCAALNVDPANILFFINLR
jgi:hypothetical protein